MSERKIDPGLVVIGLILLLLVGVGLFVYFQVRVDEISSISDAGKNIPVLYVVSDKDRILLGDLVIFNTRTLKLACLDIPGNLGAIIDSLKRTDSLGMLFMEKGLEEYRHFLEKLVGQDIPFYLHLKAAQFSQLVDLLGGLDVFISDSIDVTEGTAHIRIPSGRQIMSGSKVLEFLRYREDGDREQEHYNRRWTVMKAWMTRMVEKSAFFGDRTFVQLFRSRSDSNLDETAVRKYITLLKGVDFEQMISQRVIGSLRTVDGNRKLLFPHFEGQLLKDTLRQTLANLESSDAARGAAANIRVEVLNGTTQAGLARKTKEMFQNFGIEVTSVGNASTTDMEKTQVIDRTGDPAMAREVARAIKCENVVTQVDGTATVDVTVILGRDFNGWTVRN